MLFDLNITNFGTALVSNESELKYHKSHLTKSDRTANSVIRDIKNIIRELLSKSTY